jgi:endonuclease/exonuclease/phosphatase family metal-dependent hydrolase
MQFVSYNIPYGTGRDEQVDLARNADAVQGTDAIALQEVERYSTRTAIVAQVAQLADLLPGYHWIFSIVWRCRIAATILKSPRQCGQRVKSRSNTRFNSLAQLRRIGRLGAGGSWQSVAVALNGLESFAAGGAFGIAICAINSSGVRTIL